MELGKLFIGGISWDTSEDRLKEYFQAFGDVVEAVIMKDRATGRARGFGFVVFADPDVAERVVTVKHLIDGRNVEAKKAVPRDDQNILNRNSMYGSPGPARTKKIFVGGLASTVTESDFKKYFDQFGTITDVVVMYDHNTQRPRGFGFITYDSEETVDKVLQKTFHELNGKMVEVKRAVPKELSPGPTRSQLGGYNYSPSRVSGLLNGYAPGFNPSPVGGYGVRMDGRFSHVTDGRTNFSPLGLAYGMAPNFEQGQSASYGGISNLSTTFVHGRLSPSYGGNSSRYGSPIGYIGGSGGSSSLLNATAQTLWDNASINHTSNSSSFRGSGSGNSGMGSFGNIAALWGSSAHSGQGGGTGSAYSSGRLSYGSGDFSVDLGVGFGRNNAASVVPVSSHTASNGSYDGTYTDIYESGSFYGDSTWRSSPSEVNGSSLFGVGLGNADSGVMTRNSAGYTGAYRVANRQSNRGIAA